MNFSKPANTVCLGFCILLVVVLPSCSRKISPQEAKQARLDWNLKTLVGAYEEAGFTDEKWDESATNALAEFARSRSQAINPDENWPEIIGTNSASAVQAGCDDPMIRYLYIRNYMSQTNSAKDFADAFCKTADDMQQSSYPSIRKFYVTLRAFEQMYYAYRTNVNRQTTGQLAKNLVENLAQALDDKTTPPEEVYEASSQALDHLSGTEMWYARCYSNIESQLFKNWPNESVSWLLKAEFNIKMAWFARGSGYANSVGDDQWKLFGQRLATAKKSLDKAWKLNPNDDRIPLQMMTVELGQGKGRDTMELWFGRAMVINPDDYAACSSKLYYLEPKWYGSTDEMLKFGRECVQNDKWGGRVPLILLDAHQKIRSFYVDDAEKDGYWKRPEVWADIKTAFDRFFQLNPDAVGWYHNYAWYAYHAEQWDALNEIIPKLGSINYSFFGGKDKFDQMVQLAKEHAKPAVALPQ